MGNRRDYRSGSIYQRTSDWRWIGTLDAGWNANGTRRRPTVSTKGCEGGCKPRCWHRTEINKRLRKKMQAAERGEGIGVSARTTVKQWAGEYLELRRMPPKALSPNGWNAAASPIRKWIIPTIGHKRLEALTPGDVRAVAKAQYDAGLKTATADATQRVLRTMLNRAVTEGHTVPQRVLKVDQPGKGVSDRTALTREESLACLAVASQLPHGLRWLFALLYGARQGEVLGIHDDEIDWEAGVIRLEWQLQDLQRVDRNRPELGYRIPRDYEAIQLRGMYHLVRPKSTKGSYRVLPLIPEIEHDLREWLKIRPANPWGLLFPTLRGRPSNDAYDREEWRAIQCTAEVGHPAGRWYHIHECRNFFATESDDLGTSDKVLSDLIGHASILTTRRYQSENLDAKRRAIAGMAERLEIGQGPDH